MTEQVTLSMEIVTKSATEKRHLPSGIAGIFGEANRLGCTEFRHTYIWRTYNVICEIRHAAVVTLLHI